jgi:hypothetical protein
VSEDIPNLVPAPKKKIGRPKGKAKPLAFEVPMTDRAEVKALAKRDGKPLSKTAAWKARHAVEITGLQPWMKRYAEWLANRFTDSTKKERLAACRGVSGRKITMPALQFLQDRPDFQDYLEQLTSSEILRAQATIKANMPHVVQTGFEMAQIAADAQDYKEYRQYWTPMVDRAMPKQEEKGTTAVQINISMGKDSFAAKMHQTESDPNEILVIAEPV